MTRSLRSDLRKAGHNLTDSNDDSTHSTSSRNDDIDELHAAIAELSKKIDALSKK